MSLPEDYFKYQVNDRVSFDQGPHKWHFRGEGKILLQQEYLAGPSYLVETTQGVKIQVEEIHISGKV
jgi:hypothetical protein